MSEETKRKLSWFAGVGFLMGFALLFLTIAFRNPNPASIREITLVAQEMAFYLDGSDLPNPPLVFHVGERIRLHFINQDAGMLHDVAFSQLDVSTGKIRYGETTRIEFSPKVPSESDYLCTLHPAAMKGRVLVQGNLASQ